MTAQFSINDNISWKGAFFTIWGGQAFSILGSQLVQFALIWHLTIKTGSGTVLATASLVGMLPQVILGPLVGTLVDRWNRRWIIVLANSITTLASITLAILFVLDDAAIWHIYVVMFIRSLAGSFHGNAMIASTSLMVPVENLTRILGLNHMFIGGLNVVSAPLGALLLGILPLQGLLAINGITALFVILPLLFIQIPQPARIEFGLEQYGVQSTIWQDFQAGFKYMFKWLGLLIIGLMAVLINLVVTSGYSWFPLLIKDYFGGNTIQLGWVESAIGIGVILGGALLSIWGGFESKILTSLMGVMGLGIGTLIIGLAPSSAILMTIGGALFLGLMNPIANGPIFALIQSTVKPDMQARIFSLITSLCGGMAMIGSMIAGLVTDQIGIKALFLPGGSLCILIGLVGSCILAVMNKEEKRSDLASKLFPKSRRSDKP
jgi:DHA3 family macrolide efflux protein-like MFS transporter